MKTFEDPTTKTFESQGWPEAEESYLQSLGKEGRAYVERNLHPYATERAKEFLEDREAIREYRNLWKEWEKSLSPSLQPLWRTFNEQSEFGRQQLRTQYPVLQTMEQRFASYKLRWRIRNPEIEGLLLKWGYVLSPARPQLRQPSPLKVFPAPITVPAWGPRRRLR